MGCTSHSSKTNNKTHEQLKSKLTEKLQKVVYYRHPEYGEVSLPNHNYSDTQNNCESTLYSNGVLIDGEHYTDQAGIKQYRKEYSMWKVKAFLIFIKAKISDHHTESDLALPERFQAAQELDDNIKQCIVAQGWVKTRTETVKKPSASTPSLLNHMVEQLLLQKH